MPLTRYQIRNEYGLADPELYKAAEKDDPEALLEGVAMAGLVGVLRQLGDLAEFAAEIFHNLHEEVMVTAARGHGLVARVQQLEIDFPSVEKTFLSQTSHLQFFSAPAVDWHPSLRSEQNLVTRGDLPRFVMDSYEECRGPPRLFLLDKYDVAGAGACLKRYTDPSFFKVEEKSNEVPTEDVQQEKKVRKMKKKAARLRNGETSGVGPASHAKLHQLLMKERIENGYSDPARAVKLKKRHLNGYPLDSETGKSYMAQFVESPSPEHKVVHEVPTSPPRLKFRLSNRTSKTEKDASEKSPPRNERSCSPPYAPYKPSIDDEKEVVDRFTEVVLELSSDGETDETPSSPSEVMDKTMYAVGDEGGKEDSVDGYPSDDVISEVDNYMDALTTMESEMETDYEHRVKNDLGFLNLENYRMDSDAYEEPLEFQTALADSQSIANSSTSTNDKGIYSIPYSDPSSNLAENTPSLSNEHCIAEFTDTLSNKLSTSVIAESKSDGIEVPDMYIEEVKIPDTIEVSPSNMLSTGEIVERKTDMLEVPKDMFIEEVRIPDTRSTSCGSADLVETLMSDYNQLGTISSDASLHSSNISEGAHEKKDSDYSGSEVIQVTDQDRYLTENFDGEEIGSAHSVSPTDELLCLTLPEVEMSSVINIVSTSVPDSVASYSDSRRLNDIVNGADHAIPSTEINLENSPPMVGVPESRNSTEEQLSGIPDSVPQPDTDLDERSDTMNGQEIGWHRCTADDDEEKEIVPLEVPCNHSNYADPEDRVNLGYADSAASPGEGISYSSDIVSSPGNLASSRECISDIGDQDRRGLEFTEEISPGCSVESAVKQEVLQLEVALTDSGSAPRNSVSYNESNIIILDHTEDVSVTEQGQNSLHAGDVTTASIISSQLRTWVPEPISHQPDVLLENSEDALPSTTSLRETGVPSQQFSSLQVDDIENLKADKEQLQSPVYEDQEIHESDKTKQAIGLTDSSFPNFGVHYVASQASHSAESYPDTIPRQFSSSDLMLPASQKNRGTLQAVDQLDSGPPFFGGFPESTPDHLEMPPLPPMQWRMGKFHNAPFPSLGGSLQCTRESCSTVLLSAADENVKSGFSPEREILQPQNPFVPHTDVEDETSQHNFIGLDGNAIQHTLYSSQGPNDLAGEVRPSLDSFSILPTILDDGATHAFHTSEGKIVQSGYIHLPLQAVGDAISKPDTVSSHGNLVAPLKQLATETCADDKMIQHHVRKDLEGQGDTSLNGLPETGGAIAWHPKPSASVPFFEVPKPNGNSTMKIPRPRTPLIDAVAAHDKSTLRKVTERARPQIEPKVGERDSLLEQIRMKSFSLKPAVVTRPSIQGPKTNLKVAAILEKANAIRQALAGSDDEDDADSWSDS